MLKDKVLRLRAPEPEDLEFLYKWENDPNVWLVSNTIIPFSRFVLREYLNNIDQDIYEVKQVRFMLCLVDSDDPIGMIDLYDFEHFHKRAGVGIFIPDEALRGKGYATRAINLIKEYAFKHLDLHQLYCYIAADNNPSINLFEKLDFKRSGTRKQWLRADENWIDEYLYQLIK